MSQLHLRMLGAPTLTWQDEPFPLPRRQARALLFCMADAMAPVSRSRLALLLWPEKAEASARRNLSRVLSYMRRALPHPELIRPSGDTFALNPDLARCDATRFRRLVREEEPASLADAVVLYQGHFLAGFDLPDSAEFDAWLSGRRRYYERRYLDALNDLLAAETTAGNYEGAIRYARQYLATDDLAEAIHRRLIRLYHLTGDRSAALRQFEQCTIILERELGVPPLPETRAAYDAARQGAPVATGKVTVPEPTWHTLPGLDLPLLGREAAWQDVDAAYQRLEEGGVVFIGGAPGVGKSRLMKEFAEAQAAAHQALLLVGHSSPHSLPYGPLVEALRLALAHPAVGRGVRPIWLAETARLLPELYDRFSDLPPPVDVEPEQAQARLFAALAEVFLSLAPAARPLLCLDDVHQADEATLGWLQSVTDRLAGSSLRILVTYRTQEAESLRPWQRELARAGLAADVRLGGLSPDAVAAIVRQAGEGVDDPERLAGRIHAATGGNAFFVLEVVRELLETDKLVADAPELPLPQTVQDAVLRRAGRLRPLAQQVLEIAAVLSPHLQLETMVAVSGRGEMEVAEGVQALERGQLLSVEPGRFHFHHDLAREAVYRHIRSWRRHLLHRRAAEALVQRVSQDDEELAATIAAHFATAGERTQAIDFYRKAAATATVVYAYQEAIGYLERAIELANVEAGTPAVLANLHDALGDNLAIAGEFVEAEAAYRAALALVPDEDLLQRAELERKVAATLMPQQQPEKAATVFRVALARMDGQPPEGGAESWQRTRLEIIFGLLDALYFQLQPDAMAPLHDQARALLDEVGTAEQQSVFYSRLGQMIFLRNKHQVPEECLDLARMALSYAHEAGNARLVARQEFLLGFDLLWHGSLDEADAMLGQALAAAEALGDIWLQDQCLTYLTILYRLQGKREAVTGHLPKLVEISQQVGYPNYIGVSEAHGAWLHYHEGAWEAARARAEAALAQWKDTSYPLQWLAHLPSLAVALGQERLPDAVAAARSMLDPKEQRLAVKVKAVLETAVAAWESGDKESTRANLSRALDLAQQHGFL